MIAKNQWGLETSDIKDIKYRVRPNIYLNFTFLLKGVRIFFIKQNYTIKLTILLIKDCVHFCFAYTKKSQHTVQLNKVYRVFASSEQVHHC